MPPINIENFIALAPVESGRWAASGFSADYSMGQSAGESFGEHLRQAFQVDTANASSQPRPSDTTSKPRQADRPERVRREQRDRSQEDFRGEDTVTDRRDDSPVDDARATARSDSQDTRHDPQDNSTPSGSEASGPGKMENQTDADPSSDNNADGTETAKTQIPLDGSGLVEQLVAENAQQNQQADLITQHYADQQLSNTGSEQSIAAVENTPNIETTLQATVNQTNTAQTAQAQADAVGESGKTAELPIEPETQNTSEQSHESEQSLGVELADATAEKTAGTNIPAEEARQQAATAANTTEETFSQNASAQSQVADGETLQQKNRRGSDRIEANAAADEAAERAGDADAQAAAAAPLADTAVDNRNKIKSAQNAVDKISATDATDKNMGDAKNTSSQPAQHDLSLAQRAQNAQETRTAAASGAAGVEDIDTVDRVRFVQRVARAVAGAGRDGGTLRIRLHPSELGSLRLEVTIRDGAMTARMETESQAAKNILLDSLPALRDRLAQQDIKVQQFDIDYAGGNNDGSAQNEADQHQAHDRSADRPAASQATNEAETANKETQAAPRPKRLGGAAQLDFVA